MEVAEERSFLHQGPIVECKGGGGGDTVDPAYNRRMARIAERQQDIAEEYYQFWKTSGQKELEAATAQANLGILPKQVELQEAQIGAEMEMIPYRTDYERSLMEYNKDALEARKPLARKYYEEAMTGESPERRAAEARAGVAQQMDAGRDAMRREASRLGINVNSGRFHRNLGNQSIDRAKATAGAMDLARREARDRNFARMDSAMNKKIGIGA